MKYNTRSGLKPLSINEGECYCMHSRGLKLIGIRFYPYDGENIEDERKAICIQKSLYGRIEWFYFNKGFRVIEELDTIKEVEVDENAFDSSFLLYSESMKPIVSVSAIVGQNGTGKSTIMDIVIRLLNNLSAAILGEDYVYTGAQHLHYIDNVYASLAVYIDSSIKIITCKGRKLSVTVFDVDKNTLAHEYDTSNDAVVEHYFPKSPTVILAGTESVEEVLKPQRQFKTVLQDWFYTLVSNYSLYAYNYRDYEYERTSKVRLEKLGERYSDDYKEEDEFWLKGVFHKNDGYQTPIVIHPMREDGYINAEKVNYFGKQNLISLCFEKRDIVQENGNTDHGTFPFRVINQTHHIVAFNFCPQDVDQYRGSVEDCLSSHFKLDDDLMKKVLRLEQPIKDFWSFNIGVAYNKQINNIDIQKAWDYLAYKTIKVLWTYIQYKTIWKNATDKYDENTFKKSLEELLKDSTHRTQKIRRTIAYLRFCEEPSYYMNQGTVVSVDKIYEWMKGKLGNKIYPNLDFHNIDTEDLLPPPFVDIVLQLVDNEHLKDYKADRIGVNIIPFGGLSSGERQIAYTLGNIIYHLKNIDSSKNDTNPNVDHLITLKYSYVNIILDEVELYFHPDLQRRFISLLLDSIRGLQLPSNSGINITLITHSPFVLSDIPNSNILCLTRKKGTSFYNKTFSANIHDLFNNTFILPYTIGEYAQRKIVTLVESYNNARNLRMQRGSRSLEVHEPVPCVFPRLAELNYLADIIGDDYLRKEAKDMIEEMEEWINEERGDNEED